MDGTPDSSFTSPVFNGSVQSVTIQSDGKLLVGGSFIQVGTVDQKRLVRLFEDGTIDTSFNIGTGFTSTDTSDLNPRVISMNIQEDGKILVGGKFTTFNGETSNNLVRLNSDGSRDLEFNTITGFNVSEKVSVIKTQPDGKIFIGGTFNSYQGVSSNKLIRLKGSTATLNSKSFDSDDIKISIYPNPTSDYFNINYENDVESYEIYDINGRVVLFNKNSNVANVSSLTNGIYIIKIKIKDDNFKSVRFIKK